MQVKQNRRFLGALALGAAMVLGAGNIPARADDHGGWWHQHGWGGREAHRWWDGRGWRYYAPPAIVVAPPVVVAQPPIIMAAPPPVIIAPPLYTPPPIGVFIPFGFR